MFVSHDMHGQTTCNATYPRMVPEQAPDRPYEDRRYNEDDRATRAFTEGRTRAQMFSVCLDDKV